MKLHYFPDYCGGRIITGLTRLGGTSRTVPVVCAQLGPKRYKEDFTDLKAMIPVYKGHILSGVGVGYKTIPNGVSAEEVNRINIKENMRANLLQNSLGRVNSVIVIDGSGNSVDFSVEEVPGLSIAPSNIAKADHHFHYTSYCPVDKEDFQFCLLMSLSRHGAYKFCHAVTSSYQKATNETLLASGFKIIGEGRKSPGSNHCFSFMGDCDAITEACLPALDKWYGEFDESIDAHLVSRFGVTARRKINEAA